MVYNVVYNVPCGTCKDFYVGETACTLGKRFEEHSSTDKESAVLEHLKKTGHSCSFDDVRVLATEPNYITRKIKEAIEIYKASPSLNRDQGYELPPILLQLLPSNKDDSGCHPRSHLRTHSNICLSGVTCINISRDPTELLTELKVQ